ncbi:MAG: hypothetical protein JSR46_09125, partial [Verrucomicrobia bacterium]|nr:hypothetical protein [Verrucomicrobiota bacterium]
TFAPSPSLPGQAGSGVRAPPGRFAPSPSLAGHAGSGVMAPPGRFTQGPALAGQAGSGVVPFRSTGNWNRLSHAPSSFSTSFVKQRSHNREVAGNVRSRIRNNRPGLFHSFNDQFFHDHHFHPRNFFPGANWWCSAGWSGVDSWLGWGWSYPYYYDESGDVYPDTTYETSPEAYSVQEVPGEAVVSNQQAIQGDWLSLGVFALGQNATDATYSNIIMQLALNRQGQISGTYYNSATDQTYEVEGVVDRNTQEAQWSVTGNSSAPTMSTGIYNLTQDMTNVQVQFPDGTLQNWVLVRLNS